MSINSKPKADLIAPFDNLPMGEPKLIEIFKDIINQADANQIGLATTWTQTQIEAAIQELKSFTQTEYHRKAEVLAIQTALENSIEDLDDDTFSKAETRDEIADEATARNAAIALRKASLVRIFEHTSGTLSSTPGSSSILAGNLFSDFDELLFVVLLNTNGFVSTLMPGDLIVSGTRVQISDQTQYLEVDIDSDNTLSRHNSHRAHIPFYIYGKKY